MSPAGLILALAQPVRIISNVTSPIALSDTHPAPGVPLSRIERKTGRTLAPRKPGPKELGDTGRIVGGHDAMAKQW